MRNSVRSRGYWMICAVAVAALAACSGTEDDDGSLSPGGDTGDTSMGDGGADVGGEDAELCGNGFIDFGEECDGTELGDVTCVSLGYEGGDVSCSDTCEILADECVSATGGCGDSVRDEDEECDGDDFGDDTCVTFGFDSGRLACSETCEVSTDGCSSLAVCGNDIEEEGEECDDGNLDDGDGCDGECVAEVCGDGIVHPGLGEECDVGSVVVLTCDDVEGRPAGIRRCNEDCMFEEEECPELAQCGDGNIDLGESCDDGGTEDGDGCSSTCESELCDNGTLDENEACEGDDLGGFVCLDFGFNAGALSCDSCVVDFSGCYNVVCGDGNRDAGEECDDGNRESGDGCDRRCRTELEEPVCGNDILEEGEECDDGNTDADDGCDADCVIEVGPVCGDGEMEGDEECDAGAGNGEGPEFPCRTDCTIAECGDGIVDEFTLENCDDGDDNSDEVPDACRTNCIEAYCGDSVIDTGETCDDGNFDDDDGCSSECQIEISADCGNDEVETGEECDEGDLNGTDDSNCRLDCTVASCGDGIIDEFLSEACDDGTANSDDTPDACRTNCQLPDCGDGVTDTSLDEACDDGVDNSDDTPDACRTTCQAPVCGDGVVDPVNDEACDDGVDNSDTTPDVCRTDCSFPSCGDGVIDVELGETCDDGGEEDGDGCDSVCQVESCIVPSTPYPGIDDALADAACATIQLLEGTYDEELSFDRDVLIEGVGRLDDPITEIAGAGEFRPITIAPDVTVTLRNLAVTNGFAVEEGGGCIANEGTLILEEVYIAHCLVEGEDARGAGIYTAPGSTVHATDLFMELNGANVASGNVPTGGGAIFSEGELTIEGESRFEANEVSQEGTGGTFLAPLLGGAIAVHGGSLTIGETGSTTFQSNYVLGDTVYGGAIGSVDTSITDTNSSYIDNEATGTNASGGAIACVALDEESVTTCELVSTDTLLAANIVTAEDEGFGGGVAWYGGSVMFADALINENVTQRMGESSGPGYLVGGQLGLSATSLDLGESEVTEGGLKCGGGPDADAYGAGIALLDALDSVITGTIAVNDIEDCNYSYGAGVYVEIVRPGVRVEFADSIIEQNEIDIAADAAAGGGLYVDMRPPDEAATLALTNTSVSRNTLINVSDFGYTAGGGVYIEDQVGGIYEFESVTIDNNYVRSEEPIGFNGYNHAVGGGIYLLVRGNVDIDASIRNSTISNNQLEARLGLDITAFGGGMMLDSFDSSTGDFRIEILNSTFSGNSIDTDNGEVTRNAGGAIYANFGDSSALIDVRSSTIVDNTAANAFGSVARGAAFGIEGGDTSNPQSFVVTNSIIWNNVASWTAFNTCYSDGGEYFSGGSNLIDDDTDCQFVAGSVADIVGASNDPGLGPLQDNGGPTLTHAITAGMSAYDAGDAATCVDIDDNPLTTDQRGSARPAGPQCDIGAFEGPPE